MDRREHTRYDVRAPVNFEWADQGVLHRGQGITRDISAKGMFIYSSVEPPTKADIQVQVSLRGDSDANTHLELRTRSFLVRIETTTSRDTVHGFAILNQSYQLHNGLTAVDEEDFGI